MANKGILGRKLGMTQVFDEANRIVPVTVIEAGPCRVVQLKTPERDGYAAVQLAFGDTKAQRLDEARARPPEGGRTPIRTKYLAELRVDDLSGFELGQMLEGRRVRGRRARRRHRHQQGPRLLRRDEAPQLLRARARRTATTRSTGRRARSARARRRPACSRA